MLPWQRPPPRPVPEPERKKGRRRQLHGLASHYLLQQKKKRKENFSARRERRARRWHTRASHTGAHCRHACGARHTRPLAGAQWRPTFEQNAAERAPRPGGCCALGHGHLLGVVEHQVHKLVKADNAAFNPQARLLVQPHGNARALAGKGGTHATRGRAGEGGGASAREGRNRKTKADAARLLTCYAPSAKSGR